MGLEFITPFNIESVKFELNGMHQNSSVLGLGGVGWGGGREKMLRESEIVETWRNVLQIVFVSGGGRESNCGGSNNRK